MKSDKIFSLGEVAIKVNVPEQTLNKWIAEKILEPSITADGKPMFDSGDILQLEQIYHLHNMGYSIQDIKKITKKIGLPQPDKFIKKQDKLYNYLTVGELSKRTGINPRTIKYWEEKGIIEPTTRSNGGFRLYDETYVQFCSLIQDLQLFGYSLVEIKNIADLAKTFYSIHTDSYNGKEKEKYSQIDLMTTEIEALFNRMKKLSAGIERWKKLLKEKQSDINGINKKRPKTIKKA